MCTTHPPTFPLRYPSGEPLSPRSPSLSSKALLLVAYDHRRRGWGRYHNSSYSPDIRGSPRKASMAQSFDPRPQNLDAIACKLGLHFISPGPNELRAILYKQWSSWSLLRDRAIIAGHPSVFHFYPNRLEKEVCRYRVHFLAAFFVQDLEYSLQHLRPWIERWHTSLFS